jgi:hypothetical protein
VFEHRQSGGWSSMQRACDPWGRSAIAKGCRDVAVRRDPIDRNLVKQAT